MPLGPGSIIQWEKLEGKFPRLLKLTVHHEVIENCRLGNGQRFPSVESLLGPHVFSITITEGGK